MVRRNKCLTKRETNTVDALPLDLRIDMEIVDIGAFFTVWDTAIKPVSAPPCGGVATA